MLRDEILLGQYRAGERLPSERDLAARFETSRGTVREAFKKLEQLGVAVIRPGGARVAPIECCTLDVLGPLLDVGDVPDPDLVDQVLEMFGVLIGVAARSAVVKASPEQLDRARRIAGEVLANRRNSARQHEELRRLAEHFVDVADHLVLRLMINGLRTTFWARMQKGGLRPRPNGRVYGEIAHRLSDALERRDADAVGDAMQRLNTAIRDSVRHALKPKSRS